MLTAIFPGSRREIRLGERQEHRFLPVEKQTGKLVIVLGAAHQVAVPVDRQLAHDIVVQIGVDRAVLLTEEASHISA